MKEIVTDKNLGGIQAAVHKVTCPNSVFSEAIQCPKTWTLCVIFTPNLGNLIASIELA